MWHYTMRYKKYLLLNFICVFGFILIELGLPTILARMIDVGIRNNDFGYVKQQGILMVVITVVGIIMNILLGYFGSRITTNIVADIRDDLFKKIQSYSHQEYETLGVASLITRTTNDAYQIMLFLQNILRIGFMTPMMFIVSLYMVMRTSVSLSYYVIGALPFYYFQWLRLRNFLNRYQKNNRKIWIRLIVFYVKIFQAYVLSGHSLMKNLKKNDLRKLMITIQKAQLVSFNGCCTAWILLPV